MAVLLLGFLPYANAQLKLGTNPNNINASALLELESTNQGLLLTRLTTTQMNNITTPPAGLLIYNTDSACVYIRQNNAWRNLCDAASIDIMQFITSSPGMDSIIRIIADNANNSPLRDSIFNTVQLQGNDITSTSPITVTGGIGASLQDVNISIDTTRLVPTGGLPGQVVTKDSSGRVIWQDVTITNQGDNWGVQVVQHDATLVGNGTSASPLGIDSSALAGIISYSSSRDTIIAIVNANANDVTATGPIQVTGGTGASLQDVNISIDSMRILPTGGTPGDVVIRDSSNNNVWVDITTLGDNWGTQSVVHNTTLVGNGTTASPLGIDSSSLGGIISHSSSRDTIVSIVTTSTVLHDTVVSIIGAQANDVTATGPINVTGGTGASLQDVNISIDSMRILPTGGTPGDVVIRDSSNNNVWVDITTLGDDWGNQTVVHNTTLVGAGTTVSPLGVDSSSLGGIISHSSSRDTVIAIVNASAGNLTAGNNLVSVTGGVGATLHNTSVSVNADSVTKAIVTKQLFKDSVIGIVSHNANQSPLRDSIYSTVAVQGKALTSTTPIVTISNGSKSVLAPTQVNVDTTALITFLSHSTIIDSLYNFKGFNAFGSTTGGGLLSLIVDINNDPNVLSAYTQLQLTDTSTFPSFNMGMFKNGNPSYFEAPVTGFYSLTYTASLTVNPSLLSLGATFTWGTALIKINGTPSIIQSTRTSQTLTASALGVLGLASVGNNQITALVKLNKGDRVAVGAGAVSGVSLSLIGSSTLRSRFTGYLVK